MKQVDTENPGLPIIRDGSLLELKYTPSPDQPRLSHPESGGPLKLKDTGFQVIHDGSAGLKRSHEQDLGVSNHEPVLRRSKRKRVKRSTT